jgi:hypothetical protein
MLQQALRVARRATDDPWIHRKLLFAIMEHLPTLDFERSPAELSYDCLRFATKYLGVPDPYQEEKERYTQEMLAIEHDMRRRILEADDPLRMAILYALAGNMIDLGIVSETQVEAELDRDAAELELAVDDYGKLRDALANARSAMYILDNAGEVVCDKLVIEQLDVQDVTCVVRKAPIINDVTRDDIEAVGLERLGKIVDPGVEAMGVPLTLCSPEFRKQFANADVVIAKGQANFETLEEADRPVFHLLRAKCAHIAKFFDCAQGAALLVQTPLESRAALESGTSPQE